MSQSREQTLEQATMRKVAWRLVPSLCFIYIVAFIDRINIGFAALTMSQDLRLTPSMFGWGAGIFFLAYFLFEVPSNLILYRVGARRWIARVMITWGIISSGFAFITNANEFYVMRFLLGAAEAGLFPGVILYLTFWFPKRWRGRVTAGFMSAIPVASFIAAPLSGLLLELDGLAGLKGWQWMFLVEGIPAILLSFFVLRFLTDRPEHAAWLAPAEREWLSQEMQAESGAPQQHSLQQVLGSLWSWPVLKLALVYFGLTTGLYGIELWLPQIVKGFGVSNVQVGFISAIPYLAAIMTMSLWARRSDRTGDRFGPVALACAAGCLGLVAASFVSAYVVATIVCLSVAIAGVMSARPPFWSLPSDFLSGRKAAAGIAAINAIGNLGGFLGPYLLGKAREMTGSFTLGLLVSAVTLFASTLFTLSLRRSARLRAASQDTLTLANKH